MKNLLDEIHRRSLWQVLGVYLAGSWVALQVVEQLTEAAGLPDWVRPFSLVLLVLGLPIVMATAFIQQGMTTREPEAPRQSLADVGEVEPPAMPEKGTHHRLFTWKNAVFGGVGAFALLGLLTVGYLVMRTTGIGPAGTLVAQGVLEEGGKVVLADFESADTELGSVVTGALRIDLLQSPTIKIVEQGELAESLRRMQREANEPITPAVAREIAAREGYGAVIEGEVGTAGSSYVLTARIVGGEGWTSVAAFRETAKGEDDLIEAIEELSRSIRDKAGESLRSVQSAPALQQVSTASLEALRVYTRAERLEDQGDRPGALELFERAVEIDPEFAMAYRKIGVILGNMNIRRSDEVAAVRRAYELRERLPEAERYLAEAFYYDQVVGDREAAVRAYEALLSIDPENSPALNNLANIYRTLGRAEEAEGLYVRALGVDQFQAGYQNLAISRSMAGRAQEAERTLDSAAAVLPDAAFFFENLRTDFALSAAEYDRADSLAGAFEARFQQIPIARAMAGTQRFRVDAVRGKLRSAERHVAALEGAPGFFGNPLLQANVRAGLLQQRGEMRAAAELVTDALARHRDSLAPGDRLYGGVIGTLLDAGEVSAAQALLDEWRREVPEEELGAGGRDGRLQAEAQLAAGRGDLEEALRLIDQFERGCPGTCVLPASLVRARALDASGDRTAALPEYERALTTPGLFRSFVDARWRAQILERLGQLYDEEGDLENAARYYAMFVEQWAEADPELQPRVQAAQSRLEEIVRERG